MIVLGVAAALLLTNTLKTSGLVFQEKIRTQSCESFVGARDFADFVSEAFKEQDLIYIQKFAYIRLPLDI